MSYIPKWNRILIVENELVRWEVNVLIFSGNLQTHLECRLHVW
jgi:hypothetical protein